MVARSKPRARKKPKPIGHEGDDALDKIAPDPKAKGGGNGSGKAQAGTKPKQQHFEGMEPLRVPELDSAMETYVEVRDRRMELTKREVELRGKVEELLTANQLTTYANEHFRAEIKPAETKLKVKRLDTGEGGDEDDDL